MNIFIEHNEHLKTPLYLPSQLEILKEKHEYFEVPVLKTKIQRHDNPHYWLQQDILQIKHFQYRFFQNMILIEDTIPQNNLLSQFCLKFLKLTINYFGNNKIAYINFPQVLTEVEFLPIIIRNRNKHLLYRDPTSFRTLYFEPINFDDNFLNRKIKNIRQ